MPIQQLTHIRFEAFRHRGNVIGIGGVNSIAGRKGRASSAAPAYPFTQGKADQRGVRKPNDYYRTEDSTSFVFP